MKFKSYHGSSPEIVQDLLNDTISVELGGGELGQGFYTGEQLYQAKAWAKHRFNKTQKNVLELEHSDDDVFLLNIKEMNTNQANLKRSHIKKKGETRTYIFNVDMVWSPIVGTDRISSEQYKWESLTSEYLLNSIKTPKSIL